jgi:hypothetical protein
MFQKIFYFPSQKKFLVEKNIYLESLSISKRIKFIAKVDKVLH